MCRLRILGTIVVITALLGMAMPTLAQHVTTQPSANSVTEAPRFGVRGPYTVGRTDFVIGKGTNEFFFLTAWYPALTKDKSSTPLVVPDAYKVKLYVSGDSSLKDAALDMSNGPYPVFIFSHTGMLNTVAYYIGTPTSYLPLEQHLASWGFIVLAPTHGGDTWSNFYPSLVLRLREVKRTIQFADTLTATDGSFKGMIDTERISVGGHSAGAITTYGAAGASINWPSIEEYCAEMPTDRRCADLAVQKDAMTTVMGVESSVEGMWAAIGDSAVKAIVPMAGSVEAFGQAGLAEVTVPTLIMAGSADKEVLSQWVYSAYGQVSSKDKAQVVFKGAGHLVFLTSMTDPVWNKDVAFQLINHYTTAFLLDVLKGDKEAHKALLPDAVQFAGIEYKTTMK